MARLQLALALVAAVLGSALAFVPLQPAPRAATAVRSSRASPESSSTTGIKPLSVAQALARALAAPALLLTGVLAPSSFDGAAHAISGGGKDWAEAKISEQDFSGKDLSKKDFSGAIAQKTKFDNSNLVGARLYKANLKDASFVGADLSGASLEGAALDGAIFTNAVLQSTYFTETLAKAGDVTGADFSDTLLDRFLQTTLCKKASGTNPKTGVDTRESLLCD